MSEQRQSPRRSRDTLEISRSCEMARQNRHSWDRTQDEDEGNRGGHGRVEGEGRERMVVESASSPRSETSPCFRARLSEAPVLTAIRLSLWHSQKKRREYGQDADMFESGAGASSVGRSTVPLAV
jgi:hypothetical protein